MRILRVGVVLALVLLPIKSQAQSTTDLGADKAQQFVSAFYAWYVPLALQPQGGATWEQALMKKASWFSDEIGRRLREDARAQAKVKNEIVGLDSEPFPRVTTSVRALRSRQWAFVNFHYPNAHSDLLTELATLRRQRRKE